MAENQNIKERLFQYIEFKGLSARRFSLECGFSANYATNISKGIPEDKMNTISVHFPDLNPAWLMTGEGEMLRADSAAEAPEAGEKPAGGLDQVLEQYQQVLSEMLELRKNNADLTKEVGQIRELQKRLEEERGSLMEQNKKLTDIIERLTKEG